MPSPLNRPDGLFRVIETGADDVPVSPKLKTEVEGKIAAVQTALEEMEDEMRFAWPLTI